jgi:hypothetical protein
MAFLTSTLSSTLSGSIIGSCFNLSNIRENHDQAEEHYKKSLELEPGIVL